jgi:gliding motility-associated-like protein
MKTRIILLIVLIVIGSRVTGQPSETIYPGNIAKAGYADNASYGPFNIGFNFTFFGNTYSQFYVSSNGLVTFGSGTTDATEDPIPTAATPNNSIAPFWDDLVVNPFGDILYTTVGAAPNSELIVQFRNMGFFTTPSYLGTFSVILYETSNKIQIQYRMIVLQDNARANGGSATIGIENSDGTSGVQYSYHNPTAISTGKAIAFTPSGITYSMNSDALYEGVYLTKNVTLPEPGISELISPADNAIVGVDNTFNWTASTDASTYALQISTNPDLVGAISYNAGSGLSYNLTGLLSGATYYWTIFSSNATGFTWNEVKSFTTSTTPPLAPVPQTIYTVQPQDKTIKLQYTGGDASPKTAIITSLPLQGQLYQYNAGVRGNLISSVPTTVTDAGMNVIYAATGSAGNGAGNFNFKINDAGGDSPIGTITINVSPPGVPNVLYVAKSANVEIQFDIPMADPTGKQNQFIVTVNGTPVTINSASLKTGDPYTILLTLTTPLIGTETVLVSYTQGDVTGGTGGFLFSFTDHTVPLTAQTINFPQSLSKKYSDSPFTLTATASSGLGLTYSSSNSDVATASSNVLTFHAPGISDITARQAGNATYAPVNYIKPLTVATGDQVITFNALSAKTFGDIDFSPGATASSGLSVSYSSDNPLVATIVSGNIHITGAGTAVITASQAGNSLWSPAPDVPRTLTVSKASQTITFNALSVKIYGDADFSPGASASSGLTVSYSSDNTAVATIVVGMIHITGIGAAVITALQAGNANYSAAADVPQTLTVTKANQTITFATLPAKAYGDSDFNPGATASSALPVAYASNNPGVATIVGGMIHVVGVGTAVITASQAGNANYNAAADVPQTLTVNKAVLMVTADNKSKTYGDTNPPLTITYTGFLGTDDLAVLDIAPTVTTTALQYSNVGTYPISPAGGLDNNYTLSYTDGSLTIGKAALMVTADNKSKIYGEANPLLTIIYTGFLGTDDQAVLDVAPTVSTTALQNSNTGTYPISPAGGSDNNYTLSYTDGVLTINKADQIITFDPLPAKTYGDIDFSPGASASSGLPVSYTSNNPGVATIVGRMIHVVGIGTAVITASQAGNANYNAAVDVPQTLTVNKANQTITFGALSPATYGGSDIDPGALASSGLTITYTSGNTGVATIVGGMIHIVAAGTAVITASQAGNANYSAAADVLQTLTVGKANQTITFGALSPAIYGGSDINPGASASSSLTVTYASGNTGVATIVSGMIHIVAAGTAVITASQAGNANYNAAANVPQTLVVNKANQTITFGALSAVTYGAGDVAPIATASSGLAVSFSSGNATVATFVGGMIHVTGAGTSVITASQAGNTNFNAAPDVPRTFTVNQANLTFTAENKTKVFLQPNPALTYTISGFVNGETQSVINVLPSIQTTALQNSTVGTYPIIISGGNDNSYNFLYTAGTLTITKSQQTITFAGIPQKLLVGDSYTLVASSTSGLTVLFESMDTQIATVSGNQLTGVFKGIVQIRAYHPGDQNYFAAEVFAPAEIYSTHKDIMYLFTPNSDGFNDYWELPKLSVWGKCDVRVFNRWGKLVFADANYNNLWDGSSNGSPLPEGPYYFVIKTENAGTVTGTVNIVR